MYKIPVQCTKNPMSKFLGLDFGDKTIGVAISHNGRVATGLTTLRRKEPAAIRQNLKELKAIIREHNAYQIILGLPKNMDGEENERCGKTLLFKEKLERYVKNVTVILWDERLSTRAVSRVFEGKRSDYKKNVDTMAAIYILQGFLDSPREAKSAKNAPLKNGKEDTMVDENLNNQNEEELSELLVMLNEEGDELPLQILSSREDGGDIYLLAFEPEEDEVFIFKCGKPNEVGDDDDMPMEQIAGDHKDYDKTLAMFKDDFEEFGIEVVD